MFRRVMFGTLEKEENRTLKDLSGREVAVLMPLIILMFYIGFHATPFLKEVGKSSDQVVEKILLSTNPGISQK
jgi:NADH-quinone oxidoreductase subunit M